MWPAAGTAAAPFTGGASLALPIAQAIFGGFQKIKANKELRKLQNEDISYNATPETRSVLGVARNNARHGYSAAEKAAFFQNVAANTAKSYRLGMARAGNSLSNAIGASNQIALSNSMNQFAAQDAGLQRQNQAVYNNLVAQDQQRANMNTGLEARNNQMAQQAYGTASSQGNDNIMTAIQMGSMVAPYLMGGKQPQQPNMPMIPASTTVQQPMQLPTNNVQPQLDYRNPYSNNIPLTPMTNQQQIPASQLQLQRDNPYKQNTGLQFTPYSTFWDEFYK